MPQPPTLQITLSEGAFEFVQKKVASGEFTSPSEMLTESVAALQDKNEGLEHWLREVGAPAYDRMKADPSRGIPIENVERHFEEKWKQLDSQS